MFAKLARARLIAAFSAQRLSDYSQLLRVELSEFRYEIIRAVAGYVILGIAGLLCLAFLSVAIIVTAWDSDARTLTAWLVCLAWALLAIAGFAYAQNALKPPQPFATLNDEISQDLQLIREGL